MVAFLFIVLYNLTQVMQVKYDLIRLKNKLDTYIAVDEMCKFDSSLLQDTELLDLKEVHVIGEITLDALDEFEISLDVTGTMMLPCAVTLKPVAYPFAMKIEGNLEQIMEEIDENVKKIENTIDLLPIIWENILMEIPMRVVSEEAENIQREGEGWKLVTDEKEEHEENPALAKLKDLL